MRNRDLAKRLAELERAKPPPGGGFVFCPWQTILSPEEWRFVAELPRRGTFLRHRDGEGWRDLYRGNCRDDAERALWDGMVAKEPQGPAEWPLDVLLVDSPGMGHGGQRSRRG